MISRGKMKFFTFLAVLLTLSCVTINIYFPAEKVQKMADEIVKEVRPEEKAPAPEEKKGKEGFLKDFHLPDILSPSVVYAQGVTEVSNAVIRKLKNRMKERFPQLIPFFKADNIGENNKGFLSLRSASNLNIRSRARLNQLLRAENNDREALYAEVARALDIKGGQIDKVAAIFAEKWRESTRNGWSIQLDNGTWTKK